MKQVSVFKQIESMNFDELLAVKAKVETAIDTRIGDERRRLEASLKRLESLSQTMKANGSTKKARKGTAKRRTLLPKYRNPDNPKETWAGRGNRPRWLAAALKHGKKKLSDFAVGRGR
jgi:DNA-binding protein H-NS